MVKRTRHSLVKVYVHLVWTTKHRVSVLSEDILRRLCTLARESAKNQGMEVIACGGYEDHMHVFVRYRSDQHQESSTDEFLEPSNVGPMTP